MRSPSKRFHCDEPPMEESFTVHAKYSWLPTTKNLRTAFVVSEALNTPASGFQPLPGTPASAPYLTDTDSAWAHAGSFSTPSSVMGLVDLRAQMTSSGYAAAIVGRAAHIAARKKTSFFMVRASYRTG